MTLKAGDKVPAGVLDYVPFTPELEDSSACGVPGKYNVEEEWKGKKVVLFGVPGAFTPTCHANHLPPYVQKFDELKSKGADIVAVIATNDAFVMSAWTRINHAGSKIVALADTQLKWLNAAGLEFDLSAMGLGKRSKRFAAVIDDLKFTYLEVEPGRDVGVSGADAVLAHL